jgi:DNA replication protein DnaC
MNETTLMKMKKIRLLGMHDAFRTAIETGRTNDYTNDQFISMLIDAESDDRQNRRISRSITNARFPYPASIENIIYEEQRNINQNSLERIAEGKYLVSCDNILITGSTGVGKSYLATALGYQACMDSKRVLYFNANKMFSKLKMAKADGSYLKTLSKIERQHLVIIDDFGLQALDSQNRMALMEIIEDRHNKGSVIITSQLPVNKWYEIIGDKTIADAILDRLIHNAHRIELKGESMRKKRVRKTDKF